MYENDMKMVREWSENGERMVSGWYGNNVEWYEHGVKKAVQS